MTSNWQTLVHLKTVCHTGIDTSFIPRFMRGSCWEVMSPFQVWQKKVDPYKTYPRTQRTIEKGSRFRVLKDWPVRGSKFNTDLLVEELLTPEDFMRDMDAEKTWKNSDQLNQNSYWINPLNIDVKRIKDPEPFYLIKDVKKDRWIVEPNGNPSYRIWKTLDGCLDFYARIRDLNRHVIFLVTDSQPILIDEFPIPQSWIDRTLMLRNIGVIIGCRLPLEASLEAITFDKPEFHGTYRFVTEKTKFFMPPKKLISLHERVSDGVAAKLRGSERMIFLDLRL